MTSKEHPDIDLVIEMKLEDWAREENIRRPYRAISNVTILDIRRIAYAYLTLCGMDVTVCHRRLPEKGYRKVLSDCAWTYRKK